jgi:hypothetical protein
MFEVTKRDVLLGNHIRIDYVGCKGADHVTRRSVNYASFEVRIPPITRDNKESNRLSDEGRLPRQRCPIQNEWAK